MDTTTILLFILSSVTLNSIAQIFWKKGVQGPIKFKLKAIIKMMLDYRVITGLFIYALSALLWILVLSNADVSYAYPLISMGYITTTILSKFLLNEKIKPKRIIGIAIIIAGVIIVGASL